MDNIKFYKSSDGLYYVGNDIYPAGIAYLVIDGTTIEVPKYGKTGFVIQKREVSTITDESGTPYADIMALLAGVGDFFKSGSSGSVPTTSVILNPDITTATTSGTVGSGTKSVTFVASADFAGTVLDEVLNASEVVAFATDTGYELAAIAYTITAGSLRIIILE